MRRPAESPITPIARTVPALTDLVAQQHATYRAAFVDLIALFDRFDMKDAAQMTRMMGARVGLLVEQQTTLAPARLQRSMSAHDQMRADVLSWAGDGAWFTREEVRDHFGPRDGVDLAVRTLARAGDLERKFLDGSVQWRAVRVKAEAS